MKKNIKFIIYILVLLMVFLIVLITIMKKTRSKVDNDYNYKNDKINTETFNKVNDIDTYFIVKNIMDRYIYNIKNINGDSYIDENTISISKDETIRIIREEAMNSLNSVLDEEYRRYANVDEDFITSESKKYLMQGDYSKSNIIYNILINEMYEYKYTDNITLFLVFSNIKENKLDLLIKYDNTNSTYSIFLSDYIENNNYNMNTNDINIDKTGIEQNMYNKIVKGTITEEDMAKEFFNIQKNNLIYDLKYEYNKLSNKYKEKRFPKYSDFEEYYSEIKNELQDCKLSQYGVDNLDGNKIYMLIDNFDRHYIIECYDGLINYSVQLDTYTIDSEKFLKEYNNGNASKKVQLNIDKFIKMINAKDYKNSYDLLYDGFKNNYFQTEDAYKQYIKNNLFEYNTVTYDKFSNEGETYIYELTVSNKTGNSQDTKKMTVIMKLNEGTDFIMSFSIE